MKGDVHPFEKSVKFFKTAIIQRLMKKHSRKEGIIAVMDGSIRQSDKNPIWIRAGLCKIVFKSTNTERFLMELQLPEQDCMTRKVLAKFTH